MKRMRGLRIAARRGQHLRHTSIVPAVEKLQRPESEDTGDSSAAG